MLKTGLSKVMDWNPPMVQPFDKLRAHHQRILPDFAIVLTCSGGVAIRSVPVAGEHSIGIVLVLEVQKAAELRIAMR